MLKPLFVEVSARNEGSLSPVVEAWPFLPGMGQKPIEDFRCDATKAFAHDVGFAVARGAHHWLADADPVKVQAHQTEEAQARVLEEREHLENEGPTLGQRTQRCDRLTVVELGHNSFVLVGVAGAVDAAVGCHKHHLTHLPRSLPGPGDVLRESHVSAVVSTEVPVRAGLVDEGVVFDHRVGRVLFVVGVKGASHPVPPGVRKPAPDVMVCRADESPRSLAHMETGEGGFDVAVDDRHEIKGTQHLVHLGERNGGHLRPDFFPDCLDHFARDQ
eukprot:2451009-Rhodomonas_salina.1